MKHYDKETKKYISQEEYERRKKISLKKKQTCRGGKEHDFVLVLPRYVNTIGVPTKEAIEEYYASERRRFLFSKKEKEILESVGIKVNFGYGYLRDGVSVNLQCTVCGKLEYKLDEKL